VKVTFNFNTNFFIYIAKVTTSTAKITKYISTGLSAAEVKPGAGSLTGWL